MSKLRSGLANDRRRYGCYCAPYASIISGPGYLYSGSFTSVTIPGSLFDASTPTIPNTLDDGDVPIPMANMVFNFSVLITQIIYIGHLTTR
jgi:hypothetical protein